MPNLPRLNFKEAEKLLLDAGFKLIRTRGSHKIYIKDKKRVVLPFQYCGFTPLKIFTSRRKMLKPEDFFDLSQTQFKSLFDNTELRQGAYLRGDTLVGNGCVVGHTTELKSCAMLGESKAGHFAYIVDSILGKVNLGAGTKLANLKIVESN